ncbi:MAG: hypothetical protein E4H14_02050 [Candidatus Thorarchaeota archaeon]|nr:MAG: hypothetical protein E4H14_02050 [Candidatus Thorarchaeota archaeon]
MQKKIYLLTLILVFLLVTSVAAGNYDETTDKQSLATHDFLLGAVSWKSIPISCLAGDTLSGDFSLTSNGNLFIGDQTKYDNWLLDGIDFLIIDATSYELWMDNQSAPSLYERNGVVELSWSIEIPSDGTWYIIYYNDSIFMKQVEGNIQHVSPYEFTYTFVIATLLSLTFLLALLFIFKKKMSGRGN